MERARAQPGIRGHGGLMGLEAELLITERMGSNSVSKWSAPEWEEHPVIL